MKITLFSFFFDPVLRAPTLGSMLMCLASSLVGVLVFLRKRSLVGETLSHAAYPGVVLSVFITSFFTSFSEQVAAIVILIGAFISSLLGLKALDYLEKKVRVKSDSALCLILSVFFGFGVLLASRLQIVQPLWYKQAQLFLYGQAATMMDVHIWIYAALSLVIILFIAMTYRHLEAISFDPDFAKTSGLSTQLLEASLFGLLALAIVIGIRSVGVVLMAGMLIAPAAAARPFAKKLSHLLIGASVVGMASGFFGNVLSVMIPKGAYSLPTGPTILLVAAAFCMAAFFFSPGSGLISRWIRIARFKNRCRVENSLKALWKKEKEEPSSWISLQLRWRGWIDREGKLTSRGNAWAEKIVRLHRLWEVYLVDYMGQGLEKVHRNAEELEHLFTPQLEAELTLLLKDPKKDPHHQPIPKLPGGNP